MHMNKIKPVLRVLDALGVCGVIENRAAVLEEASIHLSHATDMLNQMKRIANFEECVSLEHDKLVLQISDLLEVAGEANVEDKAVQAAEEEEQLKFDFPLDSFLDYCVGVSGKNRDELAAIFARVGNQELSPESAVSAILN